MIFYKFFETVQDSIFFSIYSEAKIIIEHDKKEIISLELEQNDLKFHLKRLKKELDEKSAKNNSSSGHQSSDEEVGKRKIIELEERIEHLKEKFSNKISKLMIM